LEFPDLLQSKETLIDVFSYEEEISSDDVKVIASPYRICPLGAHIDHQGGSVLGMTINACTLMAFYPAMTVSLICAAKTTREKSSLICRISLNPPAVSGAFIPEPLPWRCRKSTTSKGG
jgi:galactokinase